jgi:hypothetical protein
MVQPPPAPLDKSLCAHANALRAMRKLDQRHFKCGQARKGRYGYVTSHAAPLSNGKFEAEMAQRGSHVERMDPELP